jgi:CRP-like cAMP-binding protein/lysophospholipase L1-like esterase
MIVATTPSAAHVVGDLVDALLEGHSEPKSDPWRRHIERIAEVNHFDRGEVLIEHHALASHVHLLVEGTLKYRHLVVDADLGETLSAERTPWMPIGWTSLDFRRYRVTVIASSAGRVLTLPLSALREMSVEDPELWALLTEFMFRTSSQMLWQARGTIGGPVSARSGPARSSPLEMEPDTEALRGMYQRSASFAPLPEGCREWLVDHSRVYHAGAGSVVVDERDPADGLWLLLSGRVAMSFTIKTGAREQTAVRYAVRPGALLCWTATTKPLPAPYRLTATREAALAFVPAKELVGLGTSQPGWLGAIFQQQLWQLRNYLMSTRTQYSGSADDGGIALLTDLIEDSKPVLPVNSPLYGVPYLLKNRLTREEGFERLYRAHFMGTEGESAVASLAIDIARDLERSHRFFQAMQSTYAAVVSSSHLDPAELRKLSSRYFRDALTHVPYVIGGMENLPDDPNCIFIYNHMAYAEDSILPNGFLFNPDSHFVSSIILEPKYGDGLRVARTNAITEFWRADYYERLGHISVATPESGWLDETPEEKERRKNTFLDDCREVLASGRPFAIAPEGTITEEDSVTERSPGPIKAGAFLMSGRLPSRPRIVPVALANFDKPAHQAVFACVIKPSFTLEEKGVDIDDREEVGRFLESYRREFRGHVKEAITLAQAIQAPEADLTGLVSNLGEVDLVDEEFEYDVRALELGVAPTRGRGPTVFYGSSTIRMWPQIGEDLGLPDAVNLGFGGSTFEACRRYFERLVLPHEPSRLVVYCGDNDISRGASADFVTDQFRQFAQMVRTYLPDSRCWFISIKPSPGRVAFLSEMEAANERIRGEIDQRDQWRYVDWFPAMLDGDGRPNERLFTSDEIHVNDEGYEVLARLLSDALSDPT